MRVSRIVACGFWLASWAASAPLGAAPPAPLATEQEKFFEDRVRPILVDNCFKCHGAKKQSGGLRLDSRQTLLKGGDNGAVLVPGDLDKSQLVQAVRHAGKLKMPKEKLQPEAIAVLEAWVKMGAPWPNSQSTQIADVMAEAWKKHWAFQPIGNPPVPETSDRQWPRNAIDRFVLAKLEAKNLKPSTEADKKTLIRRATFDLLGLPPTPAEIAAFEADGSPDAFTKVVDRLLASPHYGERWGRYWLDIARYADTRGYTFTSETRYFWAWTYRDYVTRAFNEDLPYDRFVLEQLAADLLPLGKDRRPLTAMGFLTLGNSFLNNTHDILDDRIDVVSRGLMGLTVTCARCHDHKFDPIPTADYYSLYGVFASSHTPTVPPLFADAPKTAEYEAFEKELRAREQKVQKFLQAKRQQVSTAAKKRLAEYLLKIHSLRHQPDTQEFMLIADGKDLNPKMLARWRNYLKAAKAKHHPVFAPWIAFADLPDKEFAEKSKALAATFLANNDKSKPINSLVAKSFADNPPKTLAEAANRYAELMEQVDLQWKDMVKKAIAAKMPAPAALADPSQEQLRQVFVATDSPVHAESLLDLELLPDRPSQEQLNKMHKAIDEWRSTGKSAPPRAMVLEEGPAPYQPYIFLRGNPGNHGPKVPRQFVAVASSKDRHPFAHGSGRLEMAQSIVARTNPLTARVQVNRVWLHHFGSAIVNTPGDFGMRSDPPTHPELLDHLATTFMADGWSVKKLHRSIMLSATYRQKSDDREDGRRLDSENVLLWKMNRRRLDLEAARDSILAVSGRLDATVGGSPMKDLTSTTANRRTIYGYIDRLNLPGVYRTFDFPSPDATSPRRDATTVPQQALFYMNNPFLSDSARLLLQRSEVAAEKDLVGKVDRLHLLLYGRKPTAQDLSLAREYLRDLSATAWERYAQALLLANEFVFVD